MPNFEFREILVWSSLERKAKHIHFHPQVTVLQGANHTGKSALLKSLVGAFGAEPAVVHRQWRRVEPHTLVRFTWQGKSYAMLHYHKGHAIFDGDGRMLRVFKRVTTELGPFLANLVGFGVRLPNRQGLAAVPPPAYLFLPFYIDQDVSWGRAWDAFARLRQFSKWRQPLAEYFAGIRDNSYYETLVERESVARAAEEARREYEALSAARARVQAQIDPGTFDLNPAAFEAELRLLVERCSELNRQEEEYKARFLQLDNARRAIITQLDIAEGALEEIAADYRYANEVLLDNHVDCPTCGARYENGFAERFSIALDEDRCRELVAELHAERGTLEGQLAALHGDLESVRAEAAELDELLARRKGEVALRDVIRAEGRKEMRAVFEANVRELQREVREQEARLEDLKKRLRQLNYLAKERRQLVENFYRDRMKQYLFALDVQSLGEREYRSLWGSFTETGSNMPRALLAYYYAVLHTIRRYSKAPFLPIVIDSPNQQAQDAAHLDAMLRFVFAHQPEDSQLIVGLEDLRGVEFEGALIQLEDRGLLRREEFESITEGTRPFVKQYIEAL